MAVTVDATKGAYIIPALAGSGYVPLAGGTLTGALTIASGTLTASAPALAITQTWNGVGQRFDTLTIDITNTNSGNSYPLIVRVGGTEQMYLTKTGDLYAQNLRVLTNGGALVWGAADLILYRDAAATLAQRNGTNQQIFRLYNTYTDENNYERLTLTGVAGTSVNITAESLGTGSDNLDVVVTPKGTGTALFPVGTFAKPGIGFIGFTGTGMFPANAGANVVISGAGLPVLNVAATYCGFPAAAVVGWGSAGSAGANPSDVAFARNAAGIVEVCSGTAGTWRDMKLRNLLNTEYHQMTEMTAPSAPAANSVRIYAEDNGAGKTRLMALFATGAAQQISIEP